MKIAIRNGVFETNSSSTHSFTISTTKDREEKLKELERVKLELENLKEDNKENFIKKEKLKEEYRNLAVSFEIKSPLAKLIWIKGLIDHAKSEEDGESYFEDIVFNFYFRLLDVYCEMENITNRDAQLRIISEGNKTLCYEKILKNEETLSEEVEDMLTTNYSFKNFAKDYEDKVQAFKDFVKQQHKKDCESCKGRVSCEYFFAEGILSECTCGYEDFYSIAKKIEKVKKDMNMKDFAREFLSDKYTVLAFEYAQGFIFWGNGEVY